MAQTEIDPAERISHRVFQTLFFGLSIIDKIQNSIPEAVDSTRETQAGMAAPTLDVDLGLSACQPVPASESEPAGRKGAKRLDLQARSRCAADTLQRLFTGWLTDHQLGPRWQLDANADIWDTRSAAASQTRGQVKHQLELRHQ
ncbi:hypothetical protein MKX08_000951 [Trichoderma sp. CBMAI-0020]|nr:hypothetical protein MKX08_000951 [Trichoderma sp. CBMAI-0020]